MAIEAANWKAENISSANDSNVAAVASVIVGRQVCANIQQQQQRQAKQLHGGKSCRHKSVSTMANNNKNLA